MYEVERRGPATTSVAAVEGVLGVGVSDDVGETTWAGDGLLLKRSREEVESEVDVDGATAEEEGTDDVVRDENVARTGAVVVVRRAVVVVEVGLLELGAGVVCTASHTVLVAPGRVCRTVTSDWPVLVSCTTDPCAQQRDAETLAGRFTHDPRWADPGKGNARARPSRRAQSSSWSGTARAVRGLSGGGSSRSRRASKWSASSREPSTVGPSWVNVALGCARAHGSVRTSWVASTVAVDTTEVTVGAPVTTVQLDAIVPRRSSGRRGEGRARRWSFGSLSLGCATPCERAHGHRPKRAPKRAGVRANDGQVEEGSTAAAGTPPKQFPGAIVN